MKAISAASIIAKVTRDRLLLQLHEEFPQYGFAAHKGYATPEHLAALQLHGPCVHHRRNFGPVAICYAESEGDALLEAFAAEPAAGVSVQVQVQVQ